MLSVLRWRLTFWFIGLSILLYVALSSAVIFVFDTGLTSLIDDELRVVSREVRPTIDYSGSTPTLKSWAKKAKARDIELLATVQLYDSNGQLIEEHGPPGFSELRNGYSTVVSPGLKIRLRSRSVKLENAGGYLQVQLSLRVKDTAMRKLFETILLLAPLLLAGLGLVGYFFAGKALRPTEESLGILRRFVADAGHELATPISVILGSAETLENNIANGTADIELVAVITRAAERMDNLAKDLILLAKMEKPYTISPLTAVRIDEVIVSAAEELMPSAISKNIAIDLSEIRNIQMLSHAESLRTMISNLIKNAIMYTDAGGKVAISLKMSGGQIQIAVTDTGIGIPDDCLRQIFGRFYRVDKSRSRGATGGGGSGLGLAIVKAIVEAHQGNISVESTVGVGTKFVVNLPAMEPVQSN